jgi:hypothetical protein
MGNLRTAVTRAAVVVAIALVACDPGDRGASHPKAGLDNTSSGGSPQAAPSLPTRQTVDAVSRGLVPPWRLTGSVTSATVFIDLSASMQGFARDKQGPLSAMMTRLKEFLARESVNEIFGAGFGTAIGTPKPLGGPSELLAVPAREANTCLAGPVEAVKRTDRAIGGMLVVVTDGVASASAGACGQACAAGTDVACVAKSLVEAAQGGIGIWLVGFRMPFEGSYYPELGSQPIVAPRGTTRPLYLWILAPNVKVGRAVTLALTAWGRTALGEDDVLSAEVWPGKWHGYRVAEQPDRGWQSSDFAAYQYAQATNVRSGAAVRSIHSVSCADPTRRDALAVPFLCLQQAAGPLVWVGQVPIVPADDGGPSNSVPGVVTVESALQPRADSVEASRDKKHQGAEAVPSGCLSSGGSPVKGDQISLVNSRWIAGCVEPRPAATRGRDRYQLLAGVGLGSSANTGSIGLKWNIRSDVGMLSPWNTEDDSKSGALGQTLGLSRLWGLVADRLSREPLETRLIELGRSDGN